MWHLEMNPFGEDVTEISAFEVYLNAKTSSKNQNLIIASVYIIVKIFEDVIVILKYITAHF